MENSLSSRKLKIDALFSAALNQTAEDRRPFLERACGEDQDLYEAVDRLLRGAEREDCFLNPETTHRGNLRQRLANPLATAMEVALPSHQPSPFLTAEHPTKAATGDNRTDSRKQRNRDDD